MVGWEIADGALVALAQDGGHDIVTDDEFENFELVIDWKLSPRANSGIFFNVVEQGNKAIYATGPESEGLHGATSRSARTPLPCGQAASLTPQGRRGCCVVRQSVTLSE